MNFTSSRGENNILQMSVANGKILFSPLEDKSSCMPRIHIFMKNICIYSYLHVCLVMPQLKLT